MSPGQALGHKLFSLCVCVCVYKNVAKLTSNYLTENSVVLSDIVRIQLI